jgi:2-amino-4-hydroxy-6-hydroxymethyldihydropteridine diphosphokinase
VSNAPDDRSHGGIHDGGTIAYVAIGANLGNRAGTMREALAMLHATDGVRVVACSSAYDTAPVGPPDQPRYLNAVAAVHTTRSPRELLTALLDIEKSLGRERSATRWTARTIDLDLILFGECVEGGGDSSASESTTGALSVPHPRFRERAFVLVPLAEIAPQARDPVTGERVESLLRACPGRSDAVRTGPLCDFPLG